MEKFLEGLAFKPALWGANRQDVQACLEDVIAVHHDEMVDKQLEYEQNVQRLKETIGAQAEQLKKQLEEANAERKKLAQQAAEAQRQLAQRTQELEETRGAVHRLAAQLEAERRTGGAQAPILAAAPQDTAAAQELAAHYKAEYASMKEMYQDERAAHRAAESTLHAVLLGKAHRPQSPAPADGGQAGAVGRTPDNATFLHRTAASGRPDLFWQVKNKVQKLAGQ